MREKRCLIKKKRRMKRRASERGIWEGRIGVGGRRECGRGGEEEYGRKMNRKSERNAKSRGKKISNCVMRPEDF